MKDNKYGELFIESVIYLVEQSCTLRMPKEHHVRQTEPMYVIMLS